MDDKTLRKTMNAAFRFVIDVEGTTQGAFTECSVPTIEWEVEEVKEGGLNTFIHQLPGRRKGARLTLKNGVGTHELVDWYIDTMQESFKRKPVSVSLLDIMLEPVMTWHLADAYPVKWSGPQLKSSDNSVAIQTLELACGEITVST